MLAALLVTPLLTGIPLQAPVVKARLAFEYQRPVEVAVDLEAGHALRRFQDLRAIAKLGVTEFKNTEHYKDALSRLRTFVAEGRVSAVPYATTVKVTGSKVEAVDEAWEKTVSVIPQTGAHKGKTVWCSSGVVNYFQAVVDEPVFVYRSDGGSALGAFATEDYDLTREAVENGDRAVVAGLLRLQRIFEVPAGSQAVMVEPQLARVVITSGKLKGKRLYVDSNAVRLTPLKKRR